MVAAKPYLSKAVFCIDNVAVDIDANDIHQFVTSFGVRVVTCHKFLLGALSGSDGVE